MNVVKDRQFELEPEYSPHSLEPLSDLEPIRLAILRSFTALILREYIPTDQIECFLEKPLDYFCGSTLKGLMMKRWDWINQWFREVSLCDKEKRLPYVKEYSSIIYD